MFGEKRTPGEIGSDKAYYEYHARELLQRLPEELPEMIDAKGNVKIKKHHPGINEMGFLKALSIYGRFSTNSADKVEEVRKLGELLRRLGKTADEFINDVKKAKQREQEEIKSREKAEQATIEKAMEKIEYIETLAQTLEQMAPHASLADIHKAVNDWGAHGKPAPYANLPQFTATMEKGMKKELEKYLNYSGDWGIRAGDTPGWRDEDDSPLSRRQKAVGRIHKIINSYL